MASILDIEAHRARLAERHFNAWPTIEARDGEVVLTVCGPVSPAVARYIARVLPTVAETADAQRLELEASR